MKPKYTSIDWFQNLLFAIDLNFECLEYEETDEDCTQNPNQTAKLELV